MQEKNHYVQEGDDYREGTSVEGKGNELGKPVNIGKEQDCTRSVFETEEEEMNCGRRKEGRIVSEKKSKKINTEAKQGIRIELEDSDTCRSEGNWRRVSRGKREWSKCVERNKR